MLASPSQLTLISGVPISSLTGTASAVDSNVTGTATLFTTELEVDDWIQMYGYFRQVSEITDNVTLQVSEAFPATGEGSIFKVGTDFIGVNPNGRIYGVCTLDFIIDAPLFVITAQQFAVTATDIVLTGNVSIVGSVVNLQKIKTTTYTALAGDYIQADTSGAPFTITLPAAPAIGTPVHIEDSALTWNTNNLTIARNGLKINGGTSDYTANVVGGKLSCVYISAGFGWSIK